MKIRGKLCRFVMETNTSTGCVPKYEKAQLATSRILLWNACMASILVGTKLLFRERVDQYHGDMSFNNSHNLS